MATVRVSITVKDSSSKSEIGCPLADGSIEISESISFAARSMSWESTEFIQIDAKSLSAALLQRTVTRAIRWSVI